MTQEELDADYYVEGYLSSKDSTDSAVWDDIPLRIAVVSCGFAVLGKQGGVCLTFENDADGFIYDR